MKKLFSNHLWLLLIILSSFVIQKANSQTPSLPLDSYFVDNNGSGTIFVVVSDTLNISEIEVQIGSKSSYSDLFSNSYVFDQYSGLQGDLSYNRVGSEILLGVGNLTLPSAVNVRVRIKDNSGNWGVYFEYISN